MSRGGIFTIISNTGEQDKLILAFESLHERLNSIAKDNITTLQQLNPLASKKQLVDSAASWMPNLLDVEQTHVVFVNATFKPYVSCAHEYTKTSAKGGTCRLGGTFEFTLPVTGEFVSDSVIHLQLKGLRSNSPEDKVRYLEMLGHRVMKNIRFKLNGQILDQYTSDRYNVHWQFKVPVNKEEGYLKSIGQEIPKLGYLTGTPATDEYREYRYIGTGNQTYKEEHPLVDMWIPLLFWFKDVQTALPNFLFPHGQTNIEIELEDEANLIAYNVESDATENIYTPPVVSVCELYMNNIFIDPAVHKIFTSKFMFQLIRVTRTHSIKKLEAPSGSIWLQSLKWPIECLYVAFRPVINLQHTMRWHRNTHIVEKYYEAPIVTPSHAFELNRVVYYEEYPVVSSLGLRSNDIPIYEDNPPEFYNSYIPTQYGRMSKTPKDLGWYMMNFNFYPGEYQPSGYINSSQGRELFLSYESAVGSDSTDTDNYQKPIIRGDNPVELIVVADCINFLLAKNNSAILQFST